MKIKSIYSHNAQAVSNFFFFQPTESRSLLWQLVKQGVDIIKIQIVPPTLSAFSTLYFSSYLINENRLTNPYLFLVRLVIASLGIIIYQVIENQLQLRPSIPFKQEKYISPEKIRVAFDEIKQERPMYFKKWLEEVLLENDEKALSFMIHRIMKGFCNGVVMSLIKKGATNDFNQIKSALENIKLNPNKAIKRQILYLMAHTTKLGEIPIEEGRIIIDFTEDKEQITDKLMSYIYGKSGQNFCIANAPEISLIDGSHHFLKKLIELITKSNYLPLEEVDYLFLNHEKSFGRLLSQKDFEDDEFQEKYAKAHTKKIEEANPFLIKLHISNRKEGHALGIFINQNNFLFVDPNLGLFECKNIEVLAHKLCCVVRQMYPDFDLGHASLLIHTPKPDCLKGVLWKNPQKCSF